MYASLKPLQAVTENKLDLFIDSSDGNAAEGNAADGNAAAVNWNNEKTDACFDPTSAPAARLISDNFTGGRGTPEGSEFQSRCPKYTKIGLGMDL